MALLMHVLDEKRLTGGLQKTGAADLEQRWVRNGHATKENDRLLQDFPTPESPTIRSLCT